MLVMRNNVTFESFIFGIGLLIDAEFHFSDEVIIRPAKLPTDHIELQAYARSQRDYGFLVALAEEVSFEIEIRGEDQRSAAANSWNHQWLLILLSIIVQSPIYHPISSTKPSKKLDRNCCHIQNIFVAPGIFNEKVKCSNAHLLEAKKLYGNFKDLLSEKAFVHATSIAAHNFNEPKKSIRMAGIWSGIEALLNVQSELNYRIPLMCALLLSSSEEKKLEIFSKTQKLYAARSKCVHGANMKSKELNECLDESLALLCDLIKLFCRNKKIPDANELKLLPLTI
jgi:hypothetical protein